MKILSIGNRKIWVAIATAAVAVLPFGSVQTTGALWSDRESFTPGGVQAGRMSLTAGDGTSSSVSYPFDALAKADIAEGDFVQRPLVVTNAGDPPIRFRLSGVSVTTTPPAGPAVTVTLAVNTVASTAACGTTTNVTGGSLLAGDVTSPNTATPAPTWISLNRGQSQVLCVRTTLKTAPATAVSYRHVFTFLAEQVARQ